MIRSLCNSPKSGFSLLSLVACSFFLSSCENAAPTNSAHKEASILVNRITSAVEEALEDGGQAHLFHLFKHLEFQRSATTPVLVGLHTEWMTEVLLHGRDAEAPLTDKARAGLKTHYLEDVSDPWGVPCRIYWLWSDGTQTLLVVSSGENKTLEMIPGDANSRGDDIVDSSISWFTGISDDVF